MYSVGRVCVKLAGRDSGKKCVIVEVLENNYVLIDGATRRRKCNKFHLEPTSATVQIKTGASHEEVAKALGIDARKKSNKVKSTKQKATRKVSSRPKTAAAPKAEKKAPVKKEAKKE